MSVSNEVLGQHVFDKIAEYINGDVNRRAGVHRIINNLSQKSIEWKNGSHMLIFVANESVRGRAFHKLIVDGTVDFDLICYVLRPTEKLSIT